MPTGEQVVCRLYNRRETDRPVAVLGTVGGAVLGFGNDSIWAKAVMLYKLGRLLQLVGLILLPVAMAGQLLPEPAVTLSGMLTIMVIGILVFYVGYKLQEVGKGK